MKRDNARLYGAVAAAAVLAGLGGCPLRRGGLGAPVLRDWCGRCARLSGGRAVGLLLFGGLALLHQLLHLLRIIFGLARQYLGRVGLWNAWLDRCGCALGRGGMVFGCCQYRRFLDRFGRGAFQLDRLFERFSINLLL